jgi:hypothetical protein
MIKVECEGDEFDRLPRWRELWNGGACGVKRCGREKLVVDGGEVREDLKVRKK